MHVRAAVKAWRLLQRADLVLYDRLVSRDVLDVVHPAARLLYVGKAANYHSRTQVLDEQRHSRNLQQDPGAAWLLL